MAKYDVIRRGARLAIYTDKGHKVFSHYDKAIVQRQLDRLNEKDGNAKMNINIK